MIDHVAEKQAMLKRANSEGSLSNEKAFRESLERFQGGIADHRPSVIDVSSSAERQFGMDIALLDYHAENNLDPSLRQICEALARIASFLARQEK